MSSKIRFIVSAPDRSQWPRDGKPEVVFVGRSNCGKSSLLNKLWSFKVAFVSSTPGRTSLLNFYAVNEKYRIVDSPGYGFAKVADTKIGFQAIREYLNERDNLRGAVLIMDVRRSWGDEEEVLKDYFNAQGISWVLVLNKIDKLNRSALQKQIKTIGEEAEAPELRAVSTLKGDGTQDLEKYIYSHFVKGKKR